MPEKHSLFLEGTIPYRPIHMPWFELQASDHMSWFWSQGQITCHVEPFEGTEKSLELGVITITVNGYVISARQLFHYDRKQSPQFRSWLRQMINSALLKQSPQLYAPLFGKGLLYS
jgi:hypothetical protein